MSSIIYTFKILSEAHYAIEATHDFFASEQEDWVQGEECAKRELYQWAKDVEAALEVEHRDEELMIWRGATKDIQSLQIGTILTSAKRKKALFLQLKTKLYNEHLPRPHADMPHIVLEDYEEAMGVFQYSSKSAAALLRLALQKLCRELGEKGKNIDADIKNLVKKGLPVHIQQALDIVRVIGNEAVHPGTIDISDNPDIAMQLFGLLNEVVEDQISKKKSIQQIYESLPQNKLDAIAERDKGNNSLDT
jgi:uncharacterized protein DUF4145